ncbi:hypothetical protein [Arthrobacter sp. MW3 TE3886]|uniref:hypothetical protein n=1 Tax=Arthrobacter sp. MW3 TE3886 TaxID=3156254 RepID=UPI0035145B10
MSNHVHRGEYEKLLDLLAEARGVTTRDGFSASIPDAQALEGLMEIVNALSDLLLAPEVDALNKAVVTPGRQPQDDFAEWLAGGTLGEPLWLALTEVLNFHSDGQREAAELIAMLGDSTCAFLDGVTKFASRVARGEVSAMGEAVSMLARRCKHRVEEQLMKNAVHQLRQSREIVREINDLRDDAQEAVGVVADSTLALHYSEYSAEQKKSADKFRFWTITIATLGGLIGAALLLGPAVSGQPSGGVPNDYVPFLQRVVVTAAVFGLAGYLARQAHQHRSLANWSASLAVQLKTFDAYLGPLTSSETKDELRKSFGARAFGDHPAMKGEPSVTPSVAAMDTAVGWVAKLTAGATK